MSKVYFCGLKERYLPEYAVDAMENICVWAGVRGYHRVKEHYTRTDIARNNLCKAFKETTQDPNDFLVMLDYDHVHPVDIIDRLIAHNVPVVSALAFKRGAPYHPCVWFKDPRDGRLKYPHHWEKRLYRVDAMGTGAVAIRRDVFDVLQSRGIVRRWFKYEYPDDALNDPSEDIYFSKIVTDAGLGIYCDFSLHTPHLTNATVEEDGFHGYAMDHPDEVAMHMMEQPPQGLLLPSNQIPLVERTM